MVGRSRRAKGKRQLLASHQRSWLWGRHLVRETLTVARWPIIDLRLADDLPHTELHASSALAARQNIAVEVVPRETITRLCHTSEHQGYLARMGPFPYCDAEDLLAGSARPAFYLVLDAIQDPFNFGAILRSADAFAVDGVFIGDRNQVPVTGMVARSSAGGVNRVPICQVPNLPRLTDSLREQSVRIVAASEKSDVPLTACDFRQATAIVIGNEGGGISPELLATCDEGARIPLRGAMGSLNAAVAAAVFCYEARRQRQGPAKTAL